MISDKLISAVLKVQLANPGIYTNKHDYIDSVISKPSLSGDTLVYWKQVGSPICRTECHINIYEFMHKCKEWAYKKGYSLVSGVFIVADDNGNAVFDYFNSCLINYIEKENRKQVLNNFKSDTEAESILKACEWILQQS